MIEIIDDVIRALSELDSFQGRVYRHWPRKNVATPAALVSRISGTVLLTEADGTEISARVTYSVDIISASQSDLDALAEEAADILARYNLHRTGTADYFDDSHKIYRTVLTVSGIVDKRGNTFRE